MGRSSDASVFRRLSAKILMLVATLIVRRTSFAVLSGGFFMRA
jgi:hypothetical protein